MHGSCNIVRYRLSIQAKLTDSAIQFRVIIFAHDVIFEIRKQSIIRFRLFIRNHIRFCGIINVVAI